MKVTIFSIWVLSALCIQVSGQEAKLLKQVIAIEVLKADRREIEMKFGKPLAASYDFYKRYKLADGILDVEYSDGLCKNDEKNGWNVKENVVTGLFLSFSRPPTLNQLGLRRKGFRKFPIKDVPGGFSFEDETNGINFTVTAQGLVESVSFYPKKVYDILLCSAK